MPLTVAAAVLCLVEPAIAEVTFEWVRVGNPGNADDEMNANFIPGIGSVSYAYRIAKLEVTNDQYSEFLNAVAKSDTKGLYQTFMDSDPRGGITQNGSSPNFTYTVKTDMANKPVNYVSFFDAMRFVNWLHNGQPTGAQDSSTTEDGVYSISDGLSETRAVDTKFFIPTENEWYKAAYHQPSVSGGDYDDYWLYPTASNIAPIVAGAYANGDIINPGANVANFNLGAVWNSQIGNVTSVGSAGLLSRSFYGTLDQGGNVWEHNESVVTCCTRGLRGGGWSATAGSLWSLERSGANPFIEILNIGFRVASFAPECVADFDTVTMAIVGSTPPNCAIDAR